MHLLNKSMESAGVQGSSEFWRPNSKQPAAKPSLLRSYDYDQIRHARRRPVDNEPAQSGQANVILVALPVVWSAKGLFRSLLKLLLYCRTARDKIVSCSHTGQPAFEAILKQELGTVTIDSKQYCACTASSIPESVASRSAPPVFAFLRR